MHESDENDTNSEPSNAADASTNKLPEAGTLMLHNSTKLHVVAFPVSSDLVALVPVTVRSGDNLNDYTVVEGL